MSVATQRRTRTRRTPTGHTPGETGVWVFVLGDMLAFAVFFAVLVWQQRHDPAGYEAGQDALHVGLGVVNTIVLLTSSLAVAAGVRLARSPRPAAAVPLFRAAIASGALFVAVKAVEWSDLASGGHGMRDGGFETYYFAFTGIHLLHVLIGMAVLAGVLRIVRRDAPTAHDRAMVESGATYWHMVDLLWIVLFALLYLLG